MQYGTKNGDQKIKINAEIELSYKRRMGKIRTIININNSGYKYFKKEAYIRNTQKKCKHGRCNVFHVKQEK